MNSLAFARLRRPEKINIWFATFKIHAQLLPAELHAEMLARCLSALAELDRKCALGKCNCIACCSTSCSRERFSSTSRSGNLESFDAISCWYIIQQIGCFYSPILGSVGAFPIRHIHERKVNTFFRGKVVVSAAVGANDVRCRVCQFGYSTIYTVGFEVNRLWHRTG